ncbi:flagellar biosynthesis protein FliQ [Rhizosaccharibacter radicis]|uniref:Flagellar biosynthetic protein FliQ n=1 Tax=Rhizosaccharibacter radicis TaxID=2782605 RepID=A0ABT1W243_9PROT|nr:flagellar biosynthesis protein FliQ [Acetobacteraceae bacterium KSS12]
MEGEIAVALRDMFMVVLKLSAPGLLTALAVGLVISVIQAVTQINESTLAFVPKVLAIGIALSLTGHFMYGTMNDYAHRVFDRLILVGGE